MSAIDQLHPAELALLKRKAKQMSDEIGVEVVIDTIRIRDGRCVAVLKAVDGISGTVFYAVPCTASRNPRWRNGDAA